MATSFQRTLRSLRGDRSGHTVFGVWSGMLLTALWLIWFRTAHLPVFIVSEEAHLEVGGHPVVADAGGRIVAVRAEVGREVIAGEVLFELDAELERGRWREERARRAALERRITGLRPARAAEKQGLAEARRAGAAGVEEARSRLRAARQSAALAEEEAQRVAALHRAGLVAEAELRRVRAASARQRLEVAALGRAVEQREAEREREISDRRVRIERLGQELVELDGQLTASAVAVRRLEEEIARRRLVAPVAGRVAEVAVLTPGSVVAPGDHLATVIPPADLLVVASFLDSEALGRLRPGQPARLRLDAFPWTEHGVVEARVTPVSEASRGPLLRVECTVLADGGGPTRFLQHGLTGSLSVEVERLSPADLALRTVGRAVRSSPSGDRREAG